MAYDPYDPLSGLDQQFELSPMEEYENELNRAMGIPNRPPAKYPPLPPAEQEAALDVLLDKSIGGLQYIGETLDKPGRAVRGLLAGKPQELANLIPFSDTLGITDKNGWFGNTALNVTDASQNTSGRDLLENVGLLDANEPGFDMGDAWGFGADVLLDPTTYIGIGALTNTGKAARAAGKGIKGVSNLGTAIKAGERGLLGLELPFTGLSYVPEFAKGPAAQAIGDTIGSVAKSVKHSKPVAAMRGLFDYRVKGQFNPYAQEAAEIATELQPPSIAKGRGKWLEHADELDKIVTDHDTELSQLVGQTVGKPGGAQDVRALVQQWTQLAGETGKPYRAFQDILTPPGMDRVTGMAPSKELGDAIGNLADGMKGSDDTLYQSIIDKGGKAHEMLEGGGIRHFPRQGQKYADDAVDQVFHSRRINPTTSGAMKPRREEIAYIPAHTVNQMKRDPRLIDDLYDPKLTRDVLLKHYGDDISRSANMLSLDDDEINSMAARIADWRTPTAMTKRSEAMTRDAIAFQLKKAAGSGTSNEFKEFAVADELAQYLATKKKGRNILSEDVMQNWLTEQTQNRIVDASLEGLHRFAHQNIGSGPIPLGKAFKDAGMNADQATLYFGKQFGPEALQKGVSKEVADAMKALMAPTGNPEWFQQMGSFVDKMTTLIKQNLYLPFPASWARNVSSGQYVNVAASGLVKTPGDLGAYAREVKQFGASMKNEAKIREYVTYGLIDPKRGSSVEEALIGMNRRGVPGSFPLNPLKPAQSKAAMQDVWKSAGEHVYGGMDDLGNVIPPTPSAIPGVDKIPGGKKARQAYNAVMETGGRATQNVELANRIPMYEYLRNHLGFSPDAAAAKVKELQFDMRELSPFERNVMRRIVPFYTYQRKIIPLMLDNLAHRPGGAVAQTIRASNMGRNNADFVPDSVGEGMSFELPGNSGAFLSQLGLPTDNLGELVAFKPTLAGTIKRTGQKLLSTTNPLFVKGPIELATGINMFSGQPQEEMFQYPTDNKLLNTVLAETPASRYITTTRQLTDDRKTLGQKAINALTGVKITQPSGGRERQIDLASRKVLNEVMRANPQVRQQVSNYVPSDVAPTDETKKLLRIESGLKKKAREESKKRKKAPQPQPVEMWPF